MLITGVLKIYFSALKSYVDFAIPSIPSILRLILSGRHKKKTLLATYTIQKKNGEEQRACSLLKPAESSAGG